MGGASSKSEAPDAILIEPLDENIFNVVNISEEVVRRFVGQPTKKSQRANEEEEQLRSELSKAQTFARILKEELSHSKGNEQQLREKLSKSEANVSELNEKLAKSSASTAMASLPADFKRSTSQSANEDLRFYQQKFDEVLQQQQEWQQDLTSKFGENLKTLEKKVQEHDFSSFCMDSEAAVVDCYRKYGDTPLNCSRVARDFLRCVEFYKENNKQSK